LKAFQTDHPGVRVVGIAVDRFEPVVAFAEEMDFNYPILVGQGNAMDAATQFGVDVFALPFTVFTAASGAVLGVRTGEIHPEHLENYLAVLADLDTADIGLDVARARIAGLR
jgi:hypothetical protein